MRRVLALSLCAFGILVLVPAAQGASQQMWQSPSGNIACAQFGSELRCDMRKVGTTPPKRPARCIGDFGHAFQVTRTGAKGRRICITDAVGGPGTPTLPYGTTWKRGGFTCTVSAAEVRCRNPRGHGFGLRIGRQRLF